MSITYQGVGYHYGDDRRAPALQDINLTINEAEFICIVGHTGSGKSTLVDQIGAVIFPTSGTVTVDGMETHIKETRRQIRKLIGHVAQYPEYQLFAETVYDDIAFGPRNYDIDEEEIYARAKEAANLLGFDLERLKTRSPFDLSGGQKRRVAIAGILVMQPKYLILDEPMAGLDPEGKHKIRAWLGKLKAEKQSVIMVTHSMEDAARFADRIIVMDRGMVALDGTVQEVFAQHKTLESLGLMEPLPMKFARTLKERLVSHGITAAADHLDPLPVTHEELTARLTGLLDADVASQAGACNASDLSAIQDGDCHGV